MMKIRATTCLTAMLLTVSAHAADDIHIWLRGFIPDAAAAAATGSANEAALHGVLRTSDGQCLATDERGWSEDTTASARLSTDFHLVLGDSALPVVRPSGQKVNSAARTRQVDCQSSQELGVTQTQLLADVVGTPAQVDAKTQISILAAVSDPQRAWSSATINYDATFTYDRETRTLDYQATTAVFPAYEAYATLNDGPVVTVFRSGPPLRSGSGDALNVELKGSVNLAARRPKAPTNLTIQ